MSYDRASVRQVLNRVQAEKRSSLTPAESKILCDAYGIPLPQEALAGSAEEAARLAAEIGFPVVMKIVSPDILHKTDAGGVVVGVKNATEAAQAYDSIIRNALAYKRDAKISGVQIQQMLTSGQEVIVGALTDPSFGKVVAFGLGGVLVEVLKDVTFRLAPASEADALSMIDGIAAAEILRGVRGAPPADRTAIARIIVAVSNLAADFPEIQELDLNPVFAGPDGRVDVDYRFDRAGRCMHLAIDGEVRHDISVLSCTPDAVVLGVARTTGGAGVAFAAGNCSLTTACTFLAIAT